MIVTIFLNLTTVPTCNRPNHTAMSIFMFFYLSILISYSIWSLGESLYSLLVLIIMVTYTSSSQFFLNIFNQSSPHSCSQNSTDNFNVLSGPSQKTTGGGPLGQCWWSPQQWLVISSAFSTLTQHLLADSPEQPPVLQAPFMVSPTQVFPFQLLHCVFTVPFICLDMFRYTSTYHCGIIAYIFIRVPCCIGLKTRSNRIYQVTGACSRLPLLGVCKCTLWCLHNNKISYRCSYHNVSLTWSKA